MNRLFNNPLAQDIGMTLLHSLWQVAALAAVFIIANRLLVRRSANLRYVMAYAALLTMFALPCATLCWLSAQPTVDSVSPRLLSDNEAANDVELAEPPMEPILGADPIVRVAPTETGFAQERPVAAKSVVQSSKIDGSVASRERFRWVLPWLSLAWATGVLAFSLRPLVALFRCRQLKSQAKPVEDPAFVDSFASLCERMGLHRPIELASSALIRVPAVVGFFRPVVLLPFSMLTGLSPQELSAIIAHELAHVRRHDYAMNLVQTAIETLLFYHPAVWWVSAIVRQEREDCCDDIAMAICGRKNYATALANLELSRSSEPNLALAANGGSLYRRIRRIVRPHENPSPAGRWLAAVVAVTALLVGAFAVFPNNSTAVAEAAATDQSTESAASAATNETSQGSFRGVKGGYQYSGQVLLPSGEPAVKANVYLVHWFPTPMKKLPAKPVATTDNEGRFSFSLESDPHGEAASGTVFAKLDGYAFAWASAAALEESGETAKRLADAPQQHRETVERDHGPMRLLADDAPVTGRVIDTEGNGVAGVSVYVAAVLGGPDNTMAAFDRVINGIGADYMKLQSALTRELRGPHVPTLLSEAKTNEEGRFTIRGIGKHRIAKVVLYGPGFVTESVYVRTSGGQTVVLPMEFARKDSSSQFIYHGRDFTLIAERSRPVVGRVTNEDGEGIAGVAITSNRSILHGIENGKVTSRRSGSDDVFATTDVKGNYRLDGLPPAGHNTLRFSNPEGESYLTAASTVDTRISEDAQQQRFAPVTKDFTLKRGLVVEGHVLDAKTGEGVAGYLRFLQPAKDGQFTASVSASQTHRSQTDGSFRITIPRVKGNLTFNAFQNHKYRMAKPNGGGTPEGLVRIVDGEVMMVGTAAMAKGHAIHDIKGTETGTIRLDIRIEPATKTTGHAIGPAGERLEDVFYVGESARLAHWRRSAKGDFDLYDVQASQPRRVAVLQRAKKLAGLRTVNSSEDSVVVQLQPWASVRGRIVDEDGEPLAGVHINSSDGGPAFEPVASPAEAMQQQAKREQPLPLPPTDEVGNSRYATDDDGRFEISGLIAGETYSLDGQHNLQELLSLRIATFARDLELKPGETRDLGNLVLKKTEPPKPVVAKQAIPLPPKPEPISAQLPNEQDSANKERELSSTLTFSGRVANPDGSQAAGALVAVIATELDGQVWRDIKTVFETTAGSDGRFHISLDGLSDKTHANAHLVTRTERSAVAWRELALRQTEQQDLGDIKLLPAEPIQCRLVSWEGRPAPNVEVGVSSIAVAVKGNEILNWLPFFGLKQPPEAWVQRMRTDENGVLTIPNIGRGHGVHLSVLPTDEFAPQGIALNTGTAEKRGERDGTYRDTVKNSRPGEVPSIPLSPAKIFEGVVRLADTAQPAANCKIEIWASQQEFGSMMSIFDKTDDQGRFRLNPYPGIRFGITAYPPEGTAYQIKQYGDVDTPLRWTSGEESKNIKIELSKGVIASGRIVDEATGKPIVNASIEYRPMGTNPNNTDDIVTGWQGITKSNEKGDFQISALPGEGWLLVHSNDRDYVLQDKTGRQLEYDKPGGMRTYAHAFVKINAADGAVNVGKVKLTPASSVTLEVVDPQGKPITEGLAISRLHVGVHAGWWQGQSPDEIAGGVVEIGGVAKGVDYPIYLLDPQQKLGAVAMINTERPTQKVMLQPCGSAVMRYVDVDGNPLAGKGLALYMVVTPGVSRFDSEAMRNEGAVGADQDFVSNIDRLNHWKNQSDDDGRLVLSALIPGATYLYPSGPEGKLKELITKSNEVRDLDTVVIDDES